MTSPTQVDHAPLLVGAPMNDMASASHKVSLRGARRAGHGLGRALRSESSVHADSDHVPVDHSRVERNCNTVVGGDIALV